MGRGRAKAKQTRIARDLKYSSGGTDLDRLRAELAGAPGAGDGSPPADDSALADDVADDDESYDDDIDEEDSG